jgi:Sap, sulfolipid-1-addressing protein
MWRTVLFMAVAACVDPAKIGVVSYILSRPGPMRRLVAYYIGGFGVSLIIGGVIVFVLDGVSIGTSSSIPPGIEIAVGVIAVLVGFEKLPHRVRDAVRSESPWIAGVSVGMPTAYYLAAVAAILRSGVGPPGRSAPFWSSIS